MGWAGVALAVVLGLVPQAARRAAERGMRVFYAACMDQRRVEGRGLAPLAPEMKRLAAIREARQLAAAVGGLHRVGIFVLFDFGPPQPARPELRTGLYLDHVEREFVLLGDAPAVAAMEAQAAVGLEVALSPAGPAEAAGNPARPVYRPLGRRQLRQLAPGFDWNAYFAALGPRPPGARPGDPDHFLVVEQLLRTTPLAAWRSYLRWEWVNAAVLWLPEAFVREEFRYHQAARRTSGGQPGRNALCTAVGEGFSAHDYRAAGVVAGDFFGDALRLHAVQSRHALW